MKEQMKKDIKSFQIIYSALIAGVAVFMLITVYLNELGPGFATEDDEGFTNLLLIVGFVFSIPSVYAGIFIFNKRTENIESKEIGEKIAIFRSAMIVRAATVEGAAFFFTVVYLITGSLYGLVGGLAGLIILLWFFPSLGRLSNELKHNFDDLKYD